MRGPNQIHSLYGSDVRDALMRAGVPRNQIAATYTGEQDLNVPTPNNTPEEQNRAVNLELH
jgi:outer membrane protein OmpA-like peptidoglycan-associated protein